MARKVTAFDFDTLVSVIQRIDQHLAVQAGKPVKTVAKVGKVRTASAQLALPPEKLLSTLSYSHMELWVGRGSINLTAQGAAWSAYLKALREADENDYQALVDFARQRSGETDAILTVSCMNGMKRYA